MNNFQVMQYKYVCDIDIFDCDKVEIFSLVMSACVWLAKKEQTK